MGDFMSFLNSVKEKIENMDYNWNSPSTYLTMVPGVAIIVQKIQFAKLLPFDTNLNNPNHRSENEKAKKFLKVCKWNLRGSMFQTLGVVFATNLLAKPIFLLLAGLATYHLLSTLTISPSYVKVVSEY